MAIILKLGVIVPAVIALYIMAFFGRLRVRVVHVLKSIGWVLLLMWHIAVVIKYFKSSSECKQESLNLWGAHLILVIEAFMSFIITLPICCFAGILIWIIAIFRKRPEQRHRRRSEIKNVILNAVALQLDPKDINDTEECSIWWDQYTNDQKVVCLPCSRYHFFHADWIEEWVKQKPECPLCKEPISLEAIKNAKKAEGDEGAKGAAPGDRFAYQRFNDEN